MKWFRWYRGTTENPKFALVARRASRPSDCGTGDRIDGAVSLTDVLAVWCVILEDAGNPGHWGTCTKDAEFIAAVLQWDDRAVSSILDEMVKIGLLDPPEGGGHHVAKWSQYQYTSDSDPTNAERQRRHYNKRNGDTKQEPNALAKRLDTDTDTEKKDDALRAPSKPHLTFSFAEFRKAYPQRKGSNPWEPARLKFEAAVKSGVEPEQIISAARRYAVEQRELKNIGTEFVKQAVTWLGQKSWQDYGPPAGVEGVGAMVWIGCHDPRYGPLADRHRLDTGFAPGHYAGQGGPGRHFPADWVASLKRTPEAA